MTYKDVFVHVDSTSRSDARADIAIDLAKRFDAALDVHFAECDPYLANLASKRPDEMFRDAAERTRIALVPKAEQAGTTLDWSETFARRDAALCRSVIFGTRHADLAILGQHDPREQTTSGVPSDLVEKVVLAAGRPVLTIPCIGDYQDIGSRVLIAWNAGREATRAVHDAMPFLVAAEDVVVVVINPFDREQDHGASPGADIHRHLATHGVDATINVIEVTDVSVADMLLSRAADYGSNLLVMGGHGKYGFPYVFEGGCTRHILAHMTTPVLMSH